MEQAESICEKYLPPHDGYRQCEICGWFKHHMEMFNREICQECYEAQFDQVEMLLDH